MMMSEQLATIRQALQVAGAIQADVNALGAGVPAEGEKVFVGANLARALAKQRLDALAHRQAMRDDAVRIISEHPDNKAIIDAYNELQARIVAANAELDAEIAVIRADIEEYVVELGETVRSDTLMAVYRKGRVSWDSKKLEGYAAAHPEIEQFKTIGKPSVTISLVGK